LFETGKCSDVTILVDGESIKAHSPILCARSEVFDKLLNGGMRESVSKEIRIEDCNAPTFKALLRFLYSDDFSCMGAMIEEAHDAAARVTCLQNVLAGSHKYALARLQSWCEQKLSEHITVNEVCSILRQAHLYDATQLTTACLRYIRERNREVLITDQFGTLAKDCPEIMLKIDLFKADISEASATPAIEAFRRSSAGKRKRDE